MKLRIKINGRDASDAEVTDADTGEDVLLSDFVLEMRPMEPVLFRAGVYGDHLDLDATIEVGTLSSFTDEEIVAEIDRRCEEKK